MKYIITEEQLNDIPEGEPSKGKTVRRLVKDIGVKEVAEIMGGLQRVIDLGYDGDIKWFARDIVSDSKFKLVFITPDGMSMYIHKHLADTLPLKELFNGDKELGKFRYGSKNDIQYAFTAVLRPVMKSDEPYYKVIGMSGDSGFGYNSIPKKYTLGKRFRNQIFNQVIDKYNLKPFMESTTINEEKEKRNVVSDEKLSSISRTVTRAFKPIYPQIEDIIVSRKLPHEEMLFITYVYVDKQLGPITEREIGESVGSFLQDNFDIISRRIFFDSVHFHYQGDGSYVFHNGRIVSK